jgi:hypothetical protein
MQVDTSPTGSRSTIGSFRTTQRIVGLSAIDLPGVNVVVLQRELPAQVRVESGRLLLREGFRLLAVVAAGEQLQDELSAKLVGFPELAQDMAVWVQVLADLTGCGLVGVRLAVVDHAMCARLHVDNVTVRLVSAYAGAGTQFVDDGDVDRSFLGQGAKGARDEDTGVLRKNGLIHAAGSGDLVLLKGERWPGNRGSGAVHRSPAASAAHPRLVMTLDALGN